MAGIKQVTAKNKRKLKNGNKGKRTLIRDYPFFKHAKPSEIYLFHSDYFEIDQTFATILTIMHNKGADDSLDYFWGINLIPRNLSQSVSVRKLQHISRVSDSWIDANQGKAEGLLQTNANDVEQDGSMKARSRLNKEKRDLLEIAEDIVGGSSYLRVALRLLVKAPTLNELDDAVAKINRQYQDRFDTVRAAPFVGEQRNELSNLLAKVERKESRNFMFTSKQLSGSYDLVTHGIEDLTGEYIGQMFGDVNNPAVILDIDNYKSHVVIAGKNEGQTLSRLKLNREKGVNVWGAKLGMVALMNSHRVVHLVLNGSNVSNIGVDLSDITSIIDMNQGDINFLEMFGKIEDEMTIFPAHLEKIVLMAKQAYEMTDMDRGVIEGNLREIATKFYVDQGMWVTNAQHNRDDIRLVGFPHEDAPDLPLFLSYLDMEYQALVQASARDNEVLHAFSILRTVFRNMLEANGDLFNTKTNKVIDDAVSSSRVIYDFSRLLRRGRGVAMAQFINALGFAVGNLQKGDVVVLHGVDYLKPEVKQYVKDQFTLLNDEGVRTVYIYNSIDQMVADQTFNEFDKADYTILGGMSSNTATDYEKAMGQGGAVNDTLRKLIVNKDNLRYYLRRGFDNVIFSMDVQIGIDDQEPVINLQE